MSAEFRLRKVIPSEISDWLERCLPTTDLLLPVTGLLFTLPLLGRSMDGGRIEEVELISSFVFLDIVRKDLLILLRLRPRARGISPLPRYSRFSIEAWSDFLKPFEGDI